MEIKTDEKRSHKFGFFPFEITKTIRCIEEKSVAIEKSQCAEKEKKEEKK